MLQAGAAPPVVVQDNGPGDSNALLGIIQFTGPVGSYTLNVVAAQSKPLLGSPAQAEIDLFVLSVQGGTDPIRILMTDTNFPGAIGGAALLTASVGGNTAAPAHFQAFLDRANAPFATAGPTVCTPGAQLVSTSPFASNVSTSCPLNGPFSLTAMAETTLAPGQQISFDYSVIANVPQCGNLGDFVWHDTNRNGIQDPGETGLNGVALTLSDSSGLLATTITGPHPVGGAPGYYQFNNVCAGTYQVDVNEATVPAGFTPTLQDVGNDATDNDSNGGPVTVVLPTNGSSNQTIDFGFVSPCTGSIGDFVWNDLNFNGVQDAGEPGIPGIVVRLTPGNQTTVTGANGFYQFTGLCAGTYTVDIPTPPPGLNPSPSNVGNPATDSNGSPTVVVLPNDNSSDPTIDFGYFAPCTGTIGNFVWQDLNRNGVQDAGEPGIQGVRLTLLDGGGNPIGMAITNASGFYQFTGVCAGPYTVVVDETSLPPGLSASPTGATTPDLDSNGNPAPVTLPANNSVDNTIDFGYMPPCAGTIGDFVWNDLNFNGVQDPGEPGIPGVVLELRRPDNSLIAMTTSGANGAYLFMGLCRGDYKVVAVPPAGFPYTPTTANVGDPATDSNSNPSMVSLPNDFANDRTVDFGYWQPASLGDFVWHDLNANGVQNAGEPGIPGVLVTLFRCNNTQVATATTGASGDYLFTNLVPGCYYVTFGTPGGFTASPANQGADNADSDSVGGTTGQYTLAAGETNLTVDAGFYRPASLGDFVWNDLNTNGVQDAGEPGIGGVLVTLLRCGSSTPVTTTTTNGSGLYLFSNLTPGCYAVSFATPAGFTPSPANVGNDATDSDSVGGTTGNYVLNSGDSDLTADAGFYRLASLGDFVWKDVNANGIQEAGEPGIQGVLVTLLRCDGSPTGLTATTSATGLYLFTNLSPACYKVQFATPAGFTPSPANVGNDATDSDSVGGMSGNYTLAAGESNLTVDAGFYQPAQLGDFVWNDLDGDGIQDGGEPGIQGVLVTLLRCDGSPTGLTQTTNASGLYLFTNLTPGCYKVQFATPAGFVATIANVGNDATDSDSVGGMTGNYTLNSGDSNLTVDAGFVAPPPPCVPSTFVFSGNSATSGSAGNIRTFIVNGISVKASAFSRKDTDGTWNTAFLGLYSSGLGVTDGSEGNGDNDRHKVDNIGGRDNYVLFEFAQPVVVNQAFLDAIGADSDISVWIGTKTDPFSNHLTLSDALLGTLTTEDNTTTSTAARWADINAGGILGNVLIIAAQASDTTPEDAFKISKLAVDCVSQPPPCVPGSFVLTGSSSTSGSAGNIRTFSAGGVSVKASAFSRKDSDGTWNTAFLGAYSSGLGVTDGSEGNGDNNRHKVDNIDGRDNYVLFEFSQPVIVDRTFLDAIGADSDISVWIGTKVDPFNNHLTLSDALLSSLTTEDNTTTSTSARWADINAGSLSGNVLVIAAQASDTTPEDAFKISKVDTVCLPGGQPFTTYTQGGWGAPPSGNNTGALLHANFATVYSTGSVQIGGTKKLTFTTAAAVQAFLPVGGTASFLTASATNPVSSAAGVFAGQVLALRLSVDFSNKGILRPGLANLTVQSGELAGYTVAQVLSLANTVLGGTTSALPSGVTISDLSGVVDAINNNFDGGIVNNGYLF
jgi:hypothetical protein